MGTFFETQCSLCISKMAAGKCLFALFLGSLWGHNRCRGGPILTPTHSHFWIFLPSYHCSWKSIKKWECGSAERETVSLSVPQYAIATRQIKRKEYTRHYEHKYTHLQVVRRRQKGSLVMHNCHYLFIITAHESATQCKQINIHTV